MTTVTSAHPNADYPRLKVGVIAYYKDAFIWYLIEFSRLAGIATPELFICVCGFMTSARTPPKTVSPQSDLKTQPLN